MLRCAWLLTSYVAVSIMAQKGPQLPSLNIDLDSLTVSGVSAGAAFAIQFHVSYSKSIKGVGIIAGPPFYCAAGNIDIALNNCMKDPSLIYVQNLIDATDYAFATGTIDDPANIANDKIWIFTGEKDTVVVPGVVAKTDQYYQNYVNGQSLFFRTSIPAEHAWITDGYGKNCSFLGDPYINNCGFDAAGSMLAHFYGNESLRSAGRYNSSNLFRYDQSDYVLDNTPGAISLGQTGYVYVPEPCQDGTYECKLHIVFHGCNQDLETIGTDFVINNGMNDYAESNYMVVLYPQARKSKEIPYNPKGCFDWWGYTGPPYASKAGLQIQAVGRMISRITGSLGL
eukprot:TRINITY_DN5607_c0_g2_i1.p1 TRINITY_DN5607_c0_g2~~TRINITY_DN5607_c0_g2_i1.p1  ORF type:complete len:340 (+),score=56.70 TRINITY_DN5607_c0_g2_i1:117-1136(+)